MLSHAVLQTESSPATAAFSRRMEDVGTFTKLNYSWKNGAGTEMPTIENAQLDVLKNARKKNLLGLGASLTCFWFRRDLPL